MSIAKVGCRRKVIERIFLSKTDVIEKLECGHIHLPPAYKDGKVTKRQVQRRYVNLLPTRFCGHCRPVPHRNTVLRHIREGRG